MAGEMRLALARAPERATLRRMRILAIGDIHGCSTALHTLLDQIQPGRDDILVTIGDYVDRGPDSKGVLDTLMELERTTQLKPLLGNHEILFTESVTGKLPIEGWLNVGGRETVQSYRGTGDWDLANVSDDHLRFLEERCLRYWEGERFAFVHASANAVLPFSEQTDDWLMWTRFENTYPHVSGKVIICGHTAQKDGLPALRPQAVCIDTWAYGEGWLTCMDVNEGTFLQANQQGRTRKLSLQELSTTATSAVTRPLR